MKKKAALKKKKSKSFNPTRQDLDSAMQEYLSRGGKIKKLEDAVEDEIDILLSRF